MPSTAQLRREFFPALEGTKTGRALRLLSKHPVGAKTRKTSKMKSGLLFDPFVVVFEVVVVIFYASV